MAGLRRLNGYIDDDGSEQDGIALSSINLDVSTDDRWTARAVDITHGGCACPWNSYEQAHARRTAFAKRDDCPMRAVRWTQLHPSGDLHIRTRLLRYHRGRIFCPRGTVV